MGRVVAGVRGVRGWMRDHKWVREGRRFECVAKRGCARVRWMGDPGALDFDGCAKRRGCARVHWISGWARDLVG